MSSLTELSTPGTGVIQTAATNFTITLDRDDGVAVVAQSADCKEGWLHFTIPPAPQDAPILRMVSVDFTVDRGASGTEDTSIPVKFGSYQSKLYISSVTVFSSD